MTSPSNPDIPKPIEFPMKIVFRTSDEELSEEEVEEEEEDCPLGGPLGAKGEGSKGEMEEEGFGLAEWQRRDSERVGLLRSKE